MPAYERRLAHLEPRNDSNVTIETKTHLFKTRTGVRILWGAQVANVSYQHDTARFVFCIAIQIETVSQSSDIRVLRSLLFPRFITKVELGYDKARI
jgi:hypothetical protein